MAFTEFCCRASGSNLNAGTRTGNSTEPGTSADFTYASGNWVASTGVFTVASGNPQSDGVAVGDFASVYADGASVTGFVGRVTARDTTTITVSLTAKAGTAPTDGTGNRTLKIGGAWLGPNGTSGFPLTLIQNTLTNSSGDTPRVNLKNDQTYSVTASIGVSNAGPARYQGYTTAYDDKGRATIDGGASGSSYYVVSCTANDNDFVDLVVNQNGASGSAGGLRLNASKCSALRCVASNLRGAGFESNNNGNVFEECEAFSCNAANTAGTNPFYSNAFTTYVRCIAHDNAGANNDGFFVAGVLVHCIADTNGRAGFAVNANTANFSLFLYGCDAYNNVSDGVKLAATSGSNLAVVESCNLIKNGGYGVNAAGGAMKHGAILNCGFGAGTQVNASGQTNATGAMEIAGSVTYPSDVTPWVDPTNGDFRIALVQARGAGLGRYTQTASSYSGAIGYPDIGAAQHIDPPAFAGGIYGG